MGIYVIRVPDIGEGIAEVELVAWHVAREQQPLLAVGGKVHVPLLQGGRLRHGDGFLTQALHIKRKFFLPLGQHHAGIKDARLHHGFEPPAQALRVDGRGPRALRLALIIQNAHQAGGQVSGLRSGGVCGGPAHRACGRDHEVGKIGFSARPAGRLGHVQP